MFLPLQHFFLALTQLRIESRSVFSGNYYTISAGQRRKLVTLSGYCTPQHRNTTSPPRRTAKPRLAQSAAVRIHRELRETAVAILVRIQMRNPARSQLARKLSVLNWKMRFLKAGRRWWQVQRLSFRVTATVAVAVLSLGAVRILNAPPARPAKADVAHTPHRPRVVRIGPTNSLHLKSHRLSLAGAACGSRQCA